ncbi:DUF624 domain-containing protein [Jeotgalibacillus sp. ET6]|uniref:YesL family protein n=1 Tax=Jeotgalibacillus sp. ET6 TaxID=3037260 RepID=UPI0024187007|nr:DUF624 domain-containing protein [Jeotgalibacillus sp. ET6]MDG5472387.1 DUF624 domain-containing protein [Jeotgalibacillus sp. ET6]
MGKGNVLNIAKLYFILEWIMWIAYINLLWIGSVLLGLVVFGILPATVAMFTVIRDLLINNAAGKDIFKTFALTYKKEFLKSNVMGFIMLLAGFILYLNFVFIQGIEGISYYVFFTGLLFIVFVYIITLFYLIPVYVHYDLSFFQYFRHAVLIGMVSPVVTIAMILGFILLYFLLNTIPGLIPFITASTIALLLMSCTLAAFRRLENKQYAAPGIT